MESKGTNIGSNIKTNNGQKYIGLLGLSFGNYISIEKLNILEDLYFPPEWSHRIAPAIFFF